MVSENGLYSQTGENLQLPVCTAVDALQGHTHCFPLRVGTSTYSETTLWLLLLWEGHGSFLINPLPPNSQREPTGPTQPVKMCTHNILYHVSTCLINESQTMHLSTPPVHFSTSRLHLHALQVPARTKNLLILAWKLPSALKNSL